MKRFLLLFLSFLLTISFSMPSVLFSAEESPASNIGFQRPKDVRILTLYSGNRSNEVRVKFSEGFLSHLRKENQPYTMDTLELNALYHPERKAWEQKFDLFMPAIRERRYHFIVAVSDEAASIVTGHIAEIPDDVTVILANVSTVNEEIRTKHPNTVSILRVQDPWPNIELGLNLFPSAKEIYLLVSKHFWNDALDAEIREKLGPGKTLNTLYFDDDSPETLNRISRVLNGSARDSFLVSLDWDGRFVSVDLREKRWNWVTRYFDGPIFVRDKRVLDYALGGILSDTSEVGDQTGELLDRIGDGAPASALPSAILASERMVFNASDMKARGIPFRKIPQGAELLNKPQPWGSVHDDALHLAGLLFSLFCLAAAIVFAVLFFRRKKSIIGQAVYRNLPVRVFVSDREGRILFSHMEYGSASRHGAAEFHSLKDIPWIKTQVVLDVIQDVFDSGKTVVKNFDFHGDKRSVIFARTSSNVFGRTAVIAASCDAAELYQARSEAADLEHRLASVLQTVDNAVIVTDPDRTILSFNSAAVKLTGLQPQDVIGRRLDDVLRMESFEDGSAASILGDAIKNNAPTNSPRRMNILGHNSTRKITSISAAPIRDADGHVSGGVLVVRDETEAVQKQERLAMTLTLLEQIGTQTSTSYFRINLITKEVQPLVGTQLLVTPIRDGRSLPLDSWLTPESLDRLNLTLVKLRAGEMDSCSITLSSDFTGRRRYFHVYGSREILSGGKASSTYFIGMSRDITMETEQKNSLTHAIVLFETMENSIPYPIFLKDIDDNFRYVNCNEPFAGHTGRSIQNVVGHTDFELMHDPTDAEVIRAHDRQVVVSGGIQNFLEKYYDAAGNLREFRSIKQVIPDAMGKKLLLGISIDITDEEISKRRAQEQEIILRLILDHLPAMVRVKDAMNGFRYLFWNKAMAEFTGVPSEKIVGRDNLAISYLNPKIREEYLERDLKLMESGGAEHSQITAIGADGKTSDRILDEYRTLLEVGSRKFILGIGVDITESSRILAERTALTEELRHHVKLAETSNQWLRRIDPESNLNTRLKQVLSQFGGLAGADRAHIYKFSPDGSAVRLAEWSQDGVLSLETYSANEMTAILKRLESDGRVYVENLITLPDDLVEFGEILASENLRASIILPVRDGTDSIHGFIGFNYEKQMKFNDFDWQTLSAARGMYDLARERVIQYEAIAAEHALQTITFERLDVPIVIYDAERTILAINSALTTRVWGRANNDVVGKKCYDPAACRLAGTEYCTSENCALWKTIRTGKSVRNVSGKLNSLFQFQSTPIFGSDGKLQYVMEVISELGDLNDDRKTSSQVLSRTRLAQNCISALVTASDLKTPLNRIVNGLQEYFNASMACIFRYFPGEKEKTGFVREAALSAIDLPPDLAASIHSLDEKTYPHYLNLLHSPNVIRYHIASGSNIPASNPGLAELDGILRRHGFDESISVGIFSGHIWWGFLVINRKTHIPFGTNNELEVSAAARIIGCLLEKFEMKNLLECQTKVMDSIGTASLIFNAERHIVFASSEYCNMFHTNKERLLGRCCSETICLGPEILTCNADGCPLLHSLRYGACAEFDFEFAMRFFRVSSTPIPDQDGKTQFCMAVFREITNNRESGAAGKLSESASRKEKPDGTDRPKPLKTSAGKINIMNLLVKIHNQFSLELTKKKIDLKFAVDDNLPDLELDKTVFLAIVITLVSNALKHIESGGIEVSAHFSAADNVLVLAVKDTGSGLSAEQRDLMFRVIPDQPVNPASGELKLPQVAVLVRSIGGTIKVNSEPGKGTCFMMRLPLGASKNKEHALSRLGNQPEKKSEAPSILVVDDVSMNVKVLCALFRKLGFDAVGASSGQEALAHLEKNPYAWVFTDLWMPTMNGVELADTIRKNPHYDDIRIVAVTADAECRKNFDLNAFQFIMLKPVTPAKIRETLGADCPKP